eukprot:34676-Prymnesium_polylepis.1
MQSEWVQRESDAALAAAEKESEASPWPWEDVFLGLALSSAAVGAATALHIGEAVFAEQEDRLAMRNTSLIWHDRRQKRTV